jgi:hypothetical protein
MRGKVGCAVKVLPDLLLELREIKTRNDALGKKLVNRVGHAALGCQGRICLNSDRL